LNRLRTGAGNLEVSAGNNLDLQLSWLSGRQRRGGEERTGESGGRSKAMAERSHRKPFDSLWRRRVTGSRQRQQENDAADPRALAGRKHGKSWKPFFGFFDTARRCFVPEIS